MGLVENLELMYDHEIVGEFLDHFSLMSDIMENLIIGLEKQELYDSNIQELFRIFHNIKSAAGFFKIDRVGNLAQLIESYLDEARYLSGPATEEFINWLLLVSDQFEKWKLDLENNHDEFRNVDGKLLKLPKKISA